MTKLQMISDVPPKDLLAYALAADEEYMKLARVIDAMPVDDPGRRLMFGRVMAAKFPLDLYLEEIERRNDVAAQVEAVFDDEDLER